MGDLKERQREHERFICNALGIKLCVREVEYTKVLKTERRLDCTTRTLSTILDISFKEALKKQLLLAVEYETPHGNYIEITEEILKSHGFNRIKIGVVDHISVAEFMCTHKTGKYVIIADGHMIAYIDGTWYDNKDNFNKVDLFLTKYVAFAFTNQKIKEKELIINKNEYVEEKEYERKNSIKEMDREF